MLGFRLRGLGFGVWGSGFKVRDSGAPLGGEALVGRDFDELSRVVQSSRFRRTFASDTDQNPKLGLVLVHVVVLVLEVF